MKKCENCILYENETKTCKALKTIHFKEYKKSKTNKCNFYKEVR